MNNCRSLFCLLRNGSGLHCDLDWSGRLNFFSILEELNIDRLNLYNFLIRNCIVDCTKNGRIPDRLHFHSGAFRECAFFILNRYYNIVCLAFKCCIYRLNFRFLCDCFFNSFRFFLYHLRILRQLSESNNQRIIEFIGALFNFVINVAFNNDQLIRIACFILFYCFYDCDMV